MVVAGETLIDAVVAPVFHAYDVPPEAVTVPVAPAQMVAFVVEGEFGTVTVIEAVEVQPFAFVTVTV